MELQKKIIGKPISWLAIRLKAERDRLVLWTPVMLAVGIGLYFSLYREPPVWLGPVLLFPCICLATACRKQQGWRLLALALLLAAFGFSVISLRTHLLSAPAIYSTLYYREVTGTINDIEERESGERLTLSGVSIERISPRTTPPRISVTLRQSVPELEVGDKVELKAMLFPPPAPTMPGAYDFSRQYYYDQVGAVGFAPDPPVVLKHAKELAFGAWLTDLRLSLSQRIMAAMSPQNGPVAAALMVGEMSAVPQEVRDIMRDAGIYHILSISGLHMSLAVGLLYVSLRLLFSLHPPLAMRLPVKKIAAFIGLLGAFIYLLLAGYPVPAVRSFVMVACVMLAVLLNRRGISLYSLAWAATLILLVQPEALMGASFQLSFAATLAIVAFYERFGYTLRSEGRGIMGTLRLYFLGLMATSLVAGLATTPLVIYHFNRFTLWGVIANMLVVPLASFMIMPAALLAFLLMPLGLEALPLHWLDTGIGWMIGGARWVAALPQGAFSVPPLTFGGMLLAVFGGLWLCLMTGRWRYAGALGIMLGVASIALHQPYDLMISSDGRKVALRMPSGQFVFLRGRGSSYDAQSWLRYHGQEQAAELSQLSPASGLRCDGPWCMIRAYGRRIAIGSGKEAGPKACDVKADILITDAYVDDKACQPFALVIDRKFLYRNGAVGLRFNADGIAMSVAAAERRERPWSSDFQYKRMHSGISGLYHSRQAAITKP